MTTLIEDCTCRAYGFAKGVYTTALPHGIDHDRDIWFNSDVVKAYATASGEKPFAGLDATVTAYATASGTAIWGTVNEGTATAYAIAEGEILLENPYLNWVKWSNIGELNFDIGRDNVAGERPMDWRGWVYAIKKLNNRVVVYGANGITVMTPSGVHWGMNTIYRIGLKNKEAITGNDQIHFFIDSKDQLFSLGESLQKLDYSEYLSDMTNPVMSYDIESNLVYICDGTYGFVYSPEDKSFGSGPVNITGMGTLNGSLYVVSPATIITPKFNLCTDIYDLGTRKNKTIFELEFGVNMAVPFKAAIDYRADFHGSFTTTQWHDVIENGSVFITAIGREFRFRAKSLAWESFEISYINVNGIVHAH
jgi:hypothetical protein